MNGAILIDNILETTKQEKVNQSKKKSIEQEINVNNHFKKLASKDESKHDSNAHLSEISFFYENEMNLDSEEEDDLTKGSPFILIQGAHVVGKMEN